MRRVYRSARKSAAHKAHKSVTRKKARKERYMRALVIDDEARRKTAEVMAYARKHIYHPFVDDWVPGDDLSFVCYLQVGFRCVFTYSKSQETGKLYRHLSISVPTKKYPSPEACAMIAGLFEFTGADQGLMAQVKRGRWIVHQEEREPHCIVIAEELRDE